MAEYGSAEGWQNPYEGVQISTINLPSESGESFVSAEENVRNMNSVLEPSVPPPVVPAVAPILAPVLLPVVAPVAPIALPVAVPAAAPAMEQAFEPVVSPAPAVKQESLSPAAAAVKQENEPAVYNPAAAPRRSNTPHTVRSGSIRILSTPPRRSPSVGNAGKANAGESNVDEAEPEVTEVLDNRGDLILVAGEKDRCRFQVCSRTLFRASPFFEHQYRDQMDPFNARADRPMTVHVPELNPAALHVVLLLIHNRTKHVFPKLGDRNLLAETLIVTHHLEMNECLSPVAAKWMSRTWDKNALRHDDLGPLLWIAHQLGHLKCLRRVIHIIILTGRINKKGQLIGYGAAEDEPYLNYHPLVALDLVGKPFSTPYPTLQEQTH